MLNAVGIDDSIVTYEDAEPFTTNIKTIDWGDYIELLESLKEYRRDVLLQLKKS